MKLEIAWGLVSSRGLGTLRWNPWYKSWAPSLLYNPTNFTIITLATLENPFSSFSKHHFYHQKRYARGGNKLKREPHPTKDRRYTHKLLQIEILLIKPGVESSSHDWIHSSPFHSIFPFTKPSLSMNGDTRVFLPTCIVLISPPTQVTGNLAGFISTSPHLTLIRMVLLVLFQVPDLISDLHDFLNRNKA